MPRRWLPIAGVVLVALCGNTWCQSAPPAATAAANAPTPIGPATALYLELAGVGVDSSRVFKVRDANLDRDAIHLSLSDGNIAFTRDVAGRVTGALFEGEGELLIAPPLRSERASLNLFTGATILSESFTTAFLRFDDDLFHELKPALRPFQDPAEQQDFFTRADPVVRNMGAADAMRLLVAFTNDGPGPAPATHFLHLRVSGANHGTYDVYYDPANFEPVAVAQVSPVRGGTYFDIWTSFSSAAAHTAPPGTPRRSRRNARPEQLPATTPTLDAAASAEPDEDDFAGIQITDYAIHAAINPPHQLESDALLTINVTAATQRVVLFELSRFLNVSYVALVGAEGEQPLEWLQNPALHGSQRERRGNDAVAVVFPHSLAAGQQVKLRLRYAGDVLSDAGGGLFYVGARGTWFPNRGLDFARFDVEFRYPIGYTLVATGAEVSRETHGGNQLARWVSTQPIPTAGFNLGQYTRSTAIAGNVQVAVFASYSVERSFPHAVTTTVIPIAPEGQIGQRPLIQQRAVPLPADPDPAPAARSQIVAREAAHTVEWLSPRLGNFPFPALSLTQMPGHIGQGWPGMVFLPSLAFVSSQDRVHESLSSWSDELYGKIMVPHETAHQWWGDSVVWRSYHDQWLMEALANYCALLSLQADDPGDFHSALEHLRATLLQKTDNGQWYEAGPVTLGSRLNSSKFTDGYEVVVYGRGTWLFHMLHSMLADAGGTAGPGRRASGDDLFFAALRKLLEEHRYGKLSNLDVQRAFEEVLPPAARYEGKLSLDWFFASWVNGIAIPHYELADVHFGERAGRNSVSAKLLQKDAPDDCVTSIPIYGAAPGGGKPVFLGRVFADGSETAIRLAVPAGIHKLLIDPYQTVLRQ